ncbi:methionine gamma-lyase [Bacillus thermotolerans]|uniref:methionine gamma-lyase n=1 Tax=Bacillus thermotolerans TaxID=1221996 RepID=UPI0005895B8E|nr:methionine gamma-lyase [Bacillus thermotolerans]
MKRKYKQMETAVIHGSYDTKEHLGSLTVPIFQTSTFTFDSAEQGEKCFSGEEEGYIYSRLGNPTVQVLADKIAELEEAESGLAFGSGMAAVSAVLMSLTKSGDHILCSQGVYGCTFGLLTFMREKYHITHDFIAMETEEEIERHLRKETACIYVETPINPTMKLIDLERVANVAKNRGIPVIVDNTFSSPYLQKPLALGCDIVIHSATKYIGGHGDVIGGLAAGGRETMKRIAKTTLKDVGGVMSPFDAWLLLRGLKTLPIRMDRHCENAIYMMEKLKAHPAVKQVFYPGDQEGNDYTTMKKQMRKGGGLLSFEVHGSKAQAQQLLNQLSFIKIAVSLGDAETLIQHPATMTHSAVPEQKRQEMGISDQLVRLSVGLEAKEDIWNDLKQALDQLQ